LLLAGALIFDAVKVFAPLHDAESGEFMITGLSQVAWGSVGIVTAVCVIAAVVLLFIGKRTAKK
jgi:hypothetical protein